MQSTAELHTKFSHSLVTHWPAEISLPSLESQTPACLEETFVVLERSSAQGTAKSVPLIMGMTETRKSRQTYSTVKTLAIHHRIIPVQLSHQPTIGLVWQDNGIKQGQSTQAIPCQESANPSEEVLSLNPEISGFTEMVNRKSFYGTCTVNYRYSNGWCSTV